jgi:hypothetical protein
MIVKLKLICRDAANYPIIVGKTYDVEIYVNNLYDNNYFYCWVYFGDCCMGIPKYNFMSLEDWRDYKIENLLEE